MAEAKLTTLALAARLNDEAEIDIVQFFKRSGSCTLEQAKTALASSKQLEERLRAAPVRVFTVAQLHAEVNQFIAEQEQARQREEQELAALVSQPRSASPRPRFAAASSSSSTAVTADDEDARLALAASQLAPGEFLVRARIDLRSRDSVKEHDLRHGQVFLIDQVRSLGDGSRDAWYCGYCLEDRTQTHKWVFSQYVVKIFH